MKEKIPNPNKMKRIKGPKISADQLKKSKIRVTTYLDEDVLQALKETAESSGVRYQTFLNQLLRQSLMGESQTILDRLTKLEESVFKKKVA